MNYRFVNRFVPAGSSKDCQRARQLVLLCFGAAPIWLGFGLWYLLAFGSRAALAFTVLPGALMCTIPWVLRRTQSVVIAGNLVAAISFVAFLGLTLLRGGFPLHVLVWNLVIPMYATMLARSRINVAFWAAVCGAELAILLALELTGHAPVGVLHIPPRLEVLAQFLSLATLMGFLIFLATPIASSQDRLGNERDELERRLQQAQRLDSLSDLAGGIAHDFANVLTGMRGSLELLRHRMTADQLARGDLDTLAMCIERGAGLTRRLLAFARRDESSPREVDLNSAIDETKSVLRRLLRADITVATALAPALWAVRIDPLQLDRVLLNLAINARDAISAAGELTFRTANVDLDRRACRDFAHLHPGRYVRIDVEDTGCGMPPEVLERIFEPFFTTKGGGAGSGLGLASCFAVVRQAGGEIKVTSEVDKGTRFSIYLPAAPTDERAKPTRKSRGGIIVFEDEESIRDAIPNAEEPN